MSEVNLAGLCKGSTADSDSVCEGSNPSPAAMFSKQYRCRRLKAYGINCFPGFCITKINDVFDRCQRLKGRI